jgi:glycosyltransferase involved in cell wall biosynthesis
MTSPRGHHHEQYQLRIFTPALDIGSHINASLEAMAMGLPIVANDDGGTAEQILHGVNGFLVSGEDPSEMSVYIESLLKNPEMAEAFGKAGQKIARQKFSMELMVEGYLKVLSGAPTESHLNRRECATSNNHFPLEKINA